MVAYADLTLLEFDVQSATITPFGQKISTMLKKSNLQKSGVVTGMSWDESGEILALHDQESISFVRKQTVLDFDWESVPKVKKIKKDAANFLVKDNKVEYSSSKRDGNTDNTTSSYKKFGRRYRYTGETFVALEETWSRLTFVDKRASSYLVSAQQLNDGVVTCVGFTKESYDSQLPKAFVRKKFGTK